MTEPARLLSLREAAAAVSPDLTPSAFKREADKHHIPYHRIGRHRYYRLEDVQTLIERTRQCPDVDTARACDGGASSGSSAGPTPDAHASAAQR